MSAEGIAAEILNENRVNHARAMTSVDSVFPKQQASTNRSPDNLTRSVTLAKQIDMIDLTRDKVSALAERYRSQYRVRYRSVLRSCRKPSRLKADFFYLIQLAGAEDERQGIIKNIMEERSLAITITKESTYSTKRKQSG